MEQDIFVSEEPFENGGVPVTMGEKLRRNVEILTDLYYTSLNQLLDLEKENINGKYELEVSKKSKEVMMYERQLLDLNERYSEMSYAELTQVIAIVYGCQKVVFVPYFKEICQ